MWHCPHGKGPCPVDGHVTEAQFQAARELHKHYGNPRIAFRQMREALTDMVSTIRVFEVDGLPANEVFQRWLDGWDQPTLEQDLDDELEQAGTDREAELLDRLHRVQAPQSSGATTEGGFLRRFRRGH